MLPAHSLLHPLACSLSHVLTRATLTLAGPAGKALLGEVLGTLRKSLELDASRQQATADAESASKLREMQARQIAMLNATIADLHGQLHSQLAQSGDAVRCAGWLAQLHEHSCCAGRAAATGCKRLNAQPSTAQPEVVAHAAAAAAAITASARLVARQVRELEDARRKLVAADSANLVLVRSQEAAQRKAGEAAAEAARMRDQIGPLQTKIRWGVECRRQLARACVAARRCDCCRAAQLSALHAAAPASPRCVRMPTAPAAPALPGLCCACCPCFCQ